MAIITNKELDNKSPLSKDELNILIARAKNGDMIAKNTIIESNIGLVKSIARRYIHLFKGNTFDDLVQEGMLGLLNTIDRYDPNKGASFSTYASWWIKQSILRLLDYNDRLISGYSSKIESKIRKIHKVEDYLKLNNYPVTPKMIAKYSGFNLDEVNELIKMDKSGIHISLDAPFNLESEESNFNYIIQDESELEDSVINKIYSEKIFELAEHFLSKKEYEILCYRMGKYGRIYYLEELASKYDLTRERIYQIEIKALKKLKSIVIDVYKETTEPNKPINNNHQKTGLYKYFPNIIEEEVDEATKMLKDKYKTVVIDLFSSSLDRLNNKKAYKLSFFENNILPILKDLIEYNKIDRTTILSYFNKYTYEEITNAIEELTEEEKTILRGKFGKKLEANRHYGREKISILYNEIFPKLNRILEYNRLVSNAKEPVLKKTKCNFM